VSCAFSTPIATTTGECARGAGGLCVYKSRWTCGGNRLSDPFGRDCGPRTLCEQQLAATQRFGACRADFYEVGDSRVDGDRRLRIALLVFGAGFMLTSIFVGRVALGWNRPFEEASWCRGHLEDEDTDALELRQ